jgi:hypothetical protein
MLSFFRRIFGKSQTTTATTKMSIESYAANAKKVSKYTKFFLFQENETLFCYKFFLFDSENEITKCVLRPFFQLCCQFFRECDYFITIHRLITKQNHLRSFFRVSKWSQRCRTPFRIYVQLCFRKTI